MNPMQSVLANCMQQILQRQQNPTPSSHVEDVEGGIERYFREICNGSRPMPEALGMLICSAVAEGFKVRGSMHVDIEPTEYTQEKDVKKEHFKKALEELKDMVNNDQKNEYLSTHFSGLTGDEMAVLKELSADLSDARHAANLKINVEMLHALKKSSAAKIKK